MKSEDEIREFLRDKQTRLKIIRQEDPWSDSVVRLEVQIRILNWILDEQQFSVTK